MQDMRLDPDRPNGPPHEARLTGLGHTQEATPERQLQGFNRLDTEEAYATKAHTHLWVVIVNHKASDQMLDAQDGTANDLPILDVDTLLGPPYVGCYICETAYDPRLRLRKCPGQPGTGA